MKYIKKHKAAIVISLVIGVLLFYLQPFLIWLGELIVDFFVMSSDNFSQMYYETMAKNDTSSFISLNNYFLTLAFATASIIGILYIKRKKIDVLQRVKNQLSDIDRLKSKLDEDETNNEMTDEDIRSELADVEQSVIESQKKLEKRDFGFTIISIITPALVVLLLANYVMMRSVAQHNVGFRNQMDIILPYVGQDDVNQFRSEWCRMKNSRDFNKIQKEIKTVIHKKIK